jgi:ubiquinone/menaquinone biosynthesis C-methylase UbiE
MAAAKNYIQSQAEFPEILTWPEVLDYLSKETELNENKKVLDIGCGKGKLVCDIIKKYGCKVVGIDKKKSNIKRAKKLAKREGLKAEFQVGDAHNLPYDNEFYDATFFKGTFPLLENPKIAIKEAVRVTKRGGNLVLLESSNYEHLFDDFEEYGLEEKVRKRFRLNTLFGPEFLIYIGRKSQ